jgi:hypothetical protein
MNTITNYSDYLTFELLKIHILKRFPSVYASLYFIKLIYLFDKYYSLLLIIEIKRDIYFAEKQQNCDLIHIDLFRCSKLDFYLSFREACPTRKNPTIMLRPLQLWSHRQNYQKTTRADHNCRGRSHNCTGRSHNCRGRGHNCRERSHNCRGIFKIITYAAPSSKKCPPAILENSSTIMLFLYNYDSPSIIMIWSDYNYDPSDYNYDSKVYNYALTLLFRHSV